MKGTKPEIATLRKALIRVLTSRSLDKIVKGMNDKEFIRFFLESAEFCIPKLQRTEIKADVKVEEIEVFKIAGQEIEFASNN